MAGYDLSSPENMIKAILFDMDGVLYDSMPSHVQAWYDVATSWNIEASTDEFYLYEGRTGQSTVNLLFNRQFGRDANPEEMQRIYEQKARRFIELEQPESRPMPGALEVLQKIKDLGLQRIIVTGSGQHDLFAKLDKHFFGFFNHEQMITAYDVKFGKPHPEPYLMGLKKANVCPNEAIVVENAPLGVESAHAAGIYTIAVNTGPLPDSVLKEAGADMVLASMSELVEVLPKLLLIFQSS